jgi:hypothetical protein
MLRVEYLNKFNMQREINTSKFRKKEEGQLVERFALELSKEDGVHATKYNIFMYPDCCETV